MIERPVGDYEGVLRAPLSQNKVGEREENTSGYNKGESTSLAFVAGWCFTGCSWEGLRALTAISHMSTRHLSNWVCSPQSGIQILHPALRLTSSRKNPQ